MSFFAFLAILGVAAAAALVTAVAWSMVFEPWNRRRLRHRQRQRGEHTRTRRATLPE
jgi:hypothetical protein